MINLQELRGLNDEELKKELAKAKKELLALRMQLSQSQLKDIAKIRKLRKHIARVQTLSNEPGKQS
ncbi:MAG TPA: 50S ribosomal protein L29 [Candidatus Peregrinibacteria bacterium]|nr:50S ribosomal protein L29 [Candidatus Peregrinibacteria bacterium]